MKIRRTADGTATRTVGNDVQTSSKNIIPLRGANTEKTRRDTFTPQPRPAVQAVGLTHDLIAERARIIWQERGCSLTQDEANWREAEAQLRTELGMA